jgi:hypothetical protein
LQSSTVAARDSSISGTNLGHRPVLMSAIDGGV